MEVQASDQELTFTIRKKTSDSILLITLIFILTIIPLFLFLATNEPASSYSIHSHGRKKCDLFTGEWVPNPDAPYYTNETCDKIHEHQNCIKYGRPDRDFLKWRWKPDGCELPVFEPRGFLKLVRGKALAFVGDSVARNHMQSLICLLSRVIDQRLAS